MILDDNYRLVKRVETGKARHADLHEFLLTDRNTALVTAWDHAEADLRPFGGHAKGVVVNGMIQELELPSGRVSIERLPDGDYLVSARNTWCV